MFGLLFHLFRAKVMLLSAANIPVLAALIVLGTTGFVVTGTIQVNGDDDDRRVVNLTVKPLESTWLRGVETAKLAAFAALMSAETTSSRSTESPVERWIWPFSWRVEGPTMRSVEPSAETRAMFSRKGERKGSWINSKL